LPPESGPRHGDNDENDERARTRVTIALLASVAFVQIVGMLSRGIPGPADIAFHSIVVLPAAGFAIGLSRGLRLRIGIVAFAVLWSALSIWGGIEITRIAETYAAAQAGVAATVKPISPWFVRILAARSAFFIAAVIVLVTGRPTRTRRLGGAVLGALCVVLFVVEHVYQRG
jgi:hypothetical protein